MSFTCAGALDASCHTAVEARACCHPCRRTNPGGRRLQRGSGPTSVVQHTTKPLPIAAGRCPAHLERAVQHQPPDACTHAVRGTSRQAFRGGPAHPALKPHTAIACYHSSGLACSLQDERPTTHRTSFKPRPTRQAGHAAGCGQLLIKAFGLHDHILQCNASGAGTAARCASERGLQAAS